MSLTAGQHGKAHPKQDASLLPCTLRNPPKRVPRSGIHGPIRSESPKSRSAAVPVSCATLRSQAREASDNEAPRFHHAARRRGGGNGDGAACSGGGRVSQSFLPPG